jgi:leucyl aminopeptidase
LVGKGLCFDSGGLNLKPTGGISGMHLDKHGACSVLSAFQSIIKLNLKANVIACLGFA